MPSCIVHTTLPPSRRQSNQTQYITYKSQAAPLPLCARLRSRLESRGGGSYLLLRRGRHRLSVAATTDDTNNSFSDENTSRRAEQLKDTRDTSARAADTTSMSRLSRAANALAVTVGALTPIAGATLYAGGVLPEHVWKLFLWGSLLGASWELPLMVPGCLGEPYRLLQAISRPPFALSLLIWSAWDGLVAQAGPWAACFLLPGPHFQTFSWLELTVVVLVSQVQSLVVEVLAAVLGMWSYTPGSHWWNARLFTIWSGKSVVSSPQLIWLAASLVIYAVCLTINWPA